MFEISKEFAACCSHILTKVPPGHPCGRLHGHNYIFEFVLADEFLDERGFVVDYRELDVVKEWIDKELDHRHLNDVLGFDPTAERIAYFMCERWRPIFPKLVAVRVRETPKTCAEWRRPGK